MATARVAEMVARQFRRELPQHMRQVAMVEMVTGLVQRHIGQPTPVQRIRVTVVQHRVAGVVVANLNPHRALVGVDQQPGLAPPVQEGVGDDFADQQHQGVADVFTLR